MRLTFRNLVWNEKGQSNAVVVFQAPWSLAWKFDIFLLQLEELGMENLLFVVDNNPERL